MFGIGAVAVFLILGILSITMFVAYLVYPNKRAVKGEVLPTFLISTGIGVFLYLMSIMMIPCYYINHKDNYFNNEIISEWNIRSLKPVDSISGSFVLGSGSISGSSYFYTLTEVQDGMIMKEKYSINDTFLKETGNHKVVEYKKSFYNTRYTYLTGDKSPVHSRSWYLIEVPKGTIIEHYEVM